MVVAAGLSVFPVVPVGAQDGPTLVPDSYRVAVGAPVNLALQSAATGAPLTWDDARISWSLARVMGTQENSDRAPRADPDGKPGSVRIKTDGAAVVGVDFKPRVITMDAAALRKFAHDKGDSEVPDSAQGAQNVRLVESAKTIIRAGKAEDGQSVNISEKTAQLVEIKTMFDPSGVGIGSDIPVSVSAPGGKVKKPRVFATHIASGEVQEVHASENGVVSFRLSRAGAWRVEVYHLAAAAKTEKEVPDEGPRPDWVLSSATLTFEAGQGTKKEGEK
jgi:hypothetical protein